jgi:tripartite-type tricarboxylate transporter receptor subunit TctC
MLVDQSAKSLRGKTALGTDRTSSGTTTKADMALRAISFTCVAVAALTMAAVGNGFTADFPQRPMRFIVPLPPGGGIDIVARIIGEELEKGLGQRIVIENKPGAAGTLGTNLVARAVPDGYTMLLGSFGPLAASPTLSKNLSYDPTKDFVPVSLLATFPNVLLVNSSSPFKSVQDIIAFAKANPGQLDYGSSGVGTPPHLAMELLKQLAQIDVRHIPYNGGPPALNDLVGGRIQLMFINILTAAPFVKSGQLRALAVSTPARSPLLPDVPTMAEASGLPEFSINEWVGLLLPTGTPIAVVDRLHAEVVKVSNAVDTREKLSMRGVELTSSTPDEFASFMGAEITKWRGVILAGGIVPAEK